MRRVQKDDIRPVVVADTFYPGKADELDRELDKIISSASTKEIDGDIKALVCPHAGHMYSGQIAASGYKHLLKGNYSVVAIISPSHREYFQGISVFNGKGYETPLGVVPVASRYADALIEQHDEIESSWRGHLEEHALEVQLPFLQKLLDNASIIPIVMGEQDFDSCILLGEALANVLKDVPSIIVASSDLSHYHPYHIANEIDKSTIELIEAFDENKFMDAIQQGTSEACGGGPIISAMVASKMAGADKAKILIYQNSGDVSGDYSAVVGYVSAAFYRMN